MIHIYLRFLLHNACICVCVWHCYACHMNNSWWSFAAAHVRSVAITYTNAPSHTHILALGARTTLNRGQHLVHGHVVICRARARRMYGCVSVLLCRLLRAITDTMRVGWWTAPNTVVQFSDDCVGCHSANTSPPQYWTPVQGRFRGDIWNLTGCLDIQKQKKKIKKIRKTQMHGTTICTMVDRVQSCVAKNQKPMATIHKMKNYTSQRYSL